METAAESGEDDDHYTAVLAASYPVLPRDTRVRYLDEGAANIVYTIDIPYFAIRDSAACSPNNRSTPDPARGNSVFDGKLLRLRKDLPYTASYHVAHADFLKFIAPRFNKDDLVSQCLVYLRPSALIPQLNQELQQWEKDETIPDSYKGSCRYQTRPRKRQGVYLADDDFGLLIANQQPTKGITFIELKPKWLTQSPAAPEYSKRCRTCAKRAYSNAQRARSGEPLAEGFCPLNLVSGDEKVIFRAVKFLFGSEAQQSPGAYRKLYRLCQWAKHSPLLNHLKVMQHQLDPKGVFAADPEDKDFLTAMTLRDCSVYLHVPDDVSKPITAKLGDLDLRTPGKAGYWKSVEAPLLSEGWYLGTEKEEDKQPLDCNLFPEYWTPPDQRASLHPKQWS